jgi:uncharacterized membrane protein
VEARKERDAVEIEHTLAGLRTQLAARWEQLRMSFWFVPALMSLGAAVLALMTLAVDARLSDEALSGLTWVYGGGRGCLPRLAAYAAPPPGAAGLRGQP